MTKKEANAKMRVKYGNLWHKMPIHADRRERNALRRGRAAPSRAAPQRPARPRAAPRPAPRPTPEPYSVKAGGVIQTIGKLATGAYGLKSRPFVVVEVEPGKNRAFYMSTGTGGETSAGEWNLFGGIAAQGLMMAGWFIKPMGGKRVEKYQGVSNWLGRSVGSTPDQACRYIKSRGWPVIKEGTVAFREEALELLRRYKAAKDGGDWEVAETYRQVFQRRPEDLKWGTEVNKVLGAHGAIQAYGSLPEGDLRVQVREGRRGGQYRTVVPHQRLAFNPRRRRQR